MELLSFPAILALITIVDAIHDPRKLRIGVFTLTLILMGVFSFFELVIVSVITPQIPQDSQASIWLFLALVLLVLLGIIGLATALIINGITMIRNEGRALSHTLSLFLGMAIILYMATGFTAAYFEKVDLAALLLILAAPLGWIGYGLVAFVVYSYIYIRLTRRFGGPVGAIIVLGAGVPNGQVRPLLASRIREGMRWQAREKQRGRHPYLLMSGGQGPDEPVTEAQAMATWAVEQGADPSQIMMETYSTTTEENLFYSGALVKQNDPTTRVAVVTSGYHAFRAATLMRQLRIKGYAIGAPTARYYVPSAMLREYIALLRDNLWLNVLALTFLSLPFLLGLISRLFTL